MKPQLVAIEGIDGVGKTKAQDYIINRLQNEHENLNWATLVCGIIATSTSDAVRTLTSVAKKRKLTQTTRAAIMLAAHTESEFWLQHLMASGYGIVIADRWETSFAAYQARDLNISFDEAFNLLREFKKPNNRNLSYDTQTYVLDMDPYRLNYKPTDQIEERGRWYMAKVRENYWRLAEDYDNIHIVEYAHTNEALEHLYQKVLNDLQPFIRTLPTEPRSDTINTPSTGEF